MGKASAGGPHWFAGECMKAASHTLIMFSKVAKTSAPRSGALDFAHALAEWSGGGSVPLSGEAGAAVAAETERLVRDRSARAKTPGHAFRVMAHALLAGSNKAAESTAKVSGDGRGGVGWVGECGG